MTVRPLNWSTNGKLHYIYTRYFFKIKYACFADMCLLSDLLGTSVCQMDRQTDSFMNRVSLLVEILIFDLGQGS